MPEPAARAQDTLTLDSSPTMAMTTLYGAAVGPIGKDYYLPIFSRFEAAGQATLSWNWSACLYSLNWMIFRRLWGAALVFVGALLGVALLLVALGSLVFEWPAEMLYELLLTCVVLALVVSGAWGNALLYNRCRQAMMKAVADNKTLVQACAQLSQQASTRQRFIRLLLVNAMVLALAAAAATYLIQLRDDSATAPAPATVAGPTLAASAAEPAASASSQEASAALAPASSASAPMETAALPTAAAASTPSSAPASAASASAVPMVMPASAPSSVPTAVPASAPASAFAAPPAIKPVSEASSVLPASKSTSKPARASAPAHGKVTPAPSHVASTARATTVAVAKRHASAPAHAASKPAAKPAAKVATGKASQQAKVAVAPAKGMYINAGLFANPDNARNALAKLQAAGLPASAQELETSQGTRTRIRVGPIAKPAQAEATIQQIKALNLDAALVKP